MPHRHDPLQQSVLCAGAFFIWYIVRVLIATGLADITLTGTPFSVGISFVGDFLVVLSLYCYSQRYELNLSPGTVSLYPLCLFIVLLIVLLLLNGLYAQQENWITDLFIRDHKAVPLFLIAVILLAPICEEIIFRGFVLQGFLVWFPQQRFACAVLTSLIFAAMHSQYKHWQTVIALSLLSLLLCYARFFSGGLALPITLHIINNLIAILAWWCTDTPADTTT